MGASFSFFWGGEGWGYRARGVARARVCACDVHDMLYDAFLSREKCLELGTLAVNINVSPPTLLLHPKNNNNTKNALR
jgi:hypothetical protein